MSLVIQLTPTATAMEKALSLEGGMQLQGKYIAIGKGNQEIITDDAGRAITEVLAEKVGHVEILSAEKITLYQWRMAVDIAGLSVEDFNLSEISLEDSDHQTIAIYSATQGAHLAVTQAQEHVWIAVNLAFATMPADSVTVVHQDLPIDLFSNEKIDVIELQVEILADAIDAANANIAQLNQSVGRGEPVNIGFVYNDDETVESETHTYADNSERIINYTYNDDVTVDTYSITDNGETTTFKINYNELGNVVSEVKL